MGLGDTVKSMLRRPSSNHGSPTPGWLGLPSATSSTVAPTTEGSVPGTPGGTLKGKARAHPQANSPLNTFLWERKNGFLQALKDGKGSEWNIVMGNEAGDLDSIACSIAYAYLSSASTPKTVPLLHTGHDSLHLRPENMYAFKTGLVDVNALLCHGEIAPPIPTKLAKTSFTLVDHNKLLSVFRSDAPAEGQEPTAVEVDRVVSIIDHHDDASCHPNANPRIIKPVGSCASLVTLHFQQTIQEKYTRETFGDVALLLASAILIDTGGLKDGGKAAQEDRDAIKVLKPFVSFPPPPAAATPGATSLGLEMTPPALAAVTPPVATPKDKEPKTFETRMEEHFVVLANAKNDIVNLNTWDLLRRDYKEYDFTFSDLAASTSGTHPRIHIRCGLASVPISLKQWWTRPETAKHGVEKVFWKVVDDWMVSRKIDLLGILTNFKSIKHNKHRKQILIVVAGKGKRYDDLIERVTRGFDEEGLLPHSALKAQRKEVKRIGQRRVVAWKQKNLKSTRKQIAPLLERFVTGKGLPTITVTSPPVTTPAVEVDAPKV